MKQNNDREQLNNVSSLMEMKDVSFIKKLIEDELLTPSQKKKIVERTAKARSEILSKAIKISRSGAIEPHHIIKAAEDIGYWNPKSLKKKIEDALINGIKWLMRETHQDDGWGWHDGLSKAWDTSFSLLALSEVKKIPLHQEINQEEIEQKIKNGIKWLKDNKNTDGGWGFLPSSGSMIYETSAAVYCLSEIGEKDSVEVRNAVNFIKNSQRRGDDKGWPSDLPSDPSIHSQSGAGATSFVIKALLKSGEKRESELIKGGIDWLKKNQNEDGGWGVRKGENNIVSKTCDALDALIASNHKGSDKEIQDGANWILNKQKTVKDKRVIGWGWRQDQPRYVALLNTALSVEILLKTGVVDPMVVSPNIQWLLAQQDKDGGWGLQTPRIILSLAEYLRTSHNNI